MDTISETTYDTWGQALEAYLDEEFGWGGRRQLAEMLVRDSDKLHSMQSQIGRWINQGMAPMELRRQQIEDKLEVRIEKHGSKWRVRQL